MEVQTHDVLLTVKEAADLMRVSRAKAYQMVPELKRQGIIIKFGERSIRVNRKRLLEYLGEAA